MAKACHSIWNSVCSSCNLARSSPSCLMRFLRPIQANKLLNFVRFYFNKYHPYKWIYERIWEFEQESRNAWFKHSSIENCHKILNHMASQLCARVSCYSSCFLNPTSHAVSGLQDPIFLPSFVGMFFPCISKSAKISVRFVFGTNQGKLKFGPPEGHAAIAEALMPRDRLRIEPCFSLGNPEKGIYCGPTEPRELVVFIPVPVDTSHVQLPEHVEAVRDKLAVNLHELWAMRKIEQGWSFGEVRRARKEWRRRGKRKGECMWS